MLVLITLLAFAVLVFLVLVSLIVFSGTIEARKKGRDQDRPDTSRPGPTGQ